jgi:xanthine dehydrogenase molybdopterin-binding subunit B
MVSNKTPSGTFRGPGRFEGCFFMERLLDLAAQDLAIDPLDIRRRNLIVLREMPYRLASIEPNEGIVDSSCDSGDYAVAFECCLAEARWTEKAALQGKLIDGRYHGLGIACFIEGGGSGPKENARIAIERDGTVSVYIGSSAVGQGIETIMAQIAADALSLERVRSCTLAYLLRINPTARDVMGTPRSSGQASSKNFALPRRMPGDRGGPSRSPTASRAQRMAQVAFAEVADLPPRSFRSSKPTYTYGTQSRRRRHPTAGSTCSRRGR